MSTPTQAGKRGLVKVALNPTALASIVGGVKEYEHEIDGKTVLDDEMNTDFVQRLEGIYDAKLTLKGQRRASDTGQSMLLAAILADAPVYMQVRGIQQFEYLQLMLVAKFETSVEVNGIAEFVCELQGCGPIDGAVAGAGLGTEDRNYLGTEQNDYLSTEI